jgi:5'-3' exonuclease
MKTLIIDGNNLIHRTYWIAKNRLTESPEQVNNFHIFLTLNAIFSYASAYIPNTIYAAWDEKPDYEANVRKAMLTEYKGNRSSDILPHQNNEIIKLLFNCLSIKSIFPRELEADDVIAYICNETTGHKKILSVDKDFLQLVNEDIVWFDPIRKEEINIHNFAAKTGYPNTKEWMIAKCLSGDKSDNVSGVPKFGKVTIQKYLNGSIELNEEQKEIFHRNQEIFSLSKYSTMEREMTYYADQLKDGIDPDWDKFMDICNERELFSITKNKTKWYNLFFLKSKLTSMFS